MSLSDKLSPEDRKAYAEAYEPLAKLRDAYVACGDRLHAMWIRRKISALSSYYQKRANPPTPPTKEQTMIKVFNSSDDPNYHTDNRAGVSLTHLLTKDQMFEIAKIAYKEHGGELLDFIGLKKTMYDARRAQTHVKRALDMYPMQTTELLEQRGYRHIQPYNLEVAMRQVAEAERVFPHHFKPNEGAFYNQVEGEEFRSVCHSGKDAALKHAEYLAKKNENSVRTYQLIATTKIEEVPVMTKRVVRRP